MKAALISVFVFLISAVSASAAVYIAPTESNSFQASSLELGDVLINGSELGNTTVVQFDSLKFGLRLSFKIDNSEDLKLEGLMIQASSEKTVIDKGASNFGIFGIYTLHVPNSNNDKGVFICPEAKSLDQVTKQCNGIIKIFPSFPNLVDDLILVEIKEDYLVQGLKSGGVGLLSPDDQPEKTESDDIPVEISPKEELEKPTGSLEYPLIECAEEWICSPFQPLKCDVGHRTRTCADKNNCGTTDFRPEEVRDCESRCLENWSCSEWSGNACGTRKCLDLNRCENIQYEVEKPREFADCEKQPVQIIFENQFLILMMIVIILLLAVIFVFRRKKTVEE